MAHRVPAGTGGLRRVGMSVKPLEELLLARLHETIQRAKELALTTSASFRAVSADLARADALLKELFAERVDRAADMERLLDAVRDARDYLQEALKSGDSPDATWTSRALDVLVRALNEPAE